MTQPHALMLPPAGPVTTEERLELGRAHAIVAFHALPSGRAMRLICRQERTELAVILCTATADAYGKIPVDDCADAATVAGHIVDLARLLGR